MPAAVRRRVRDRVLFDGSPQPMWAVDEETFRFLDVNPAAVSLYGYTRDEFLRMAVADLGAAADRPPRLDALPADHSAARPAIWIHRKKDGSTIEVEGTGRPVVLGGRAARLVAVRDVSSHREAEERLRLAQIEMVGRLAAGVAHDFSNLLAAIVGHADLLSEYFEATDPRAVEVAGIRRAAETATKLTRQLRELGQTQALPRVLVDVNDVIARTRQVLARVLGEHTELIVVPEAGLWCVHGDPQQLERLLLNLVVNAREAMPAGGRITLTTRNVRVDAPLARRRSVAAGDYVELGVADTGIGMDARTRQQLFEPFFTTKARGRGKGLGLAAVHGMVRQSGGHITVASESGAGACFRICLPAASGTPAAPPRRAPREALSGAVHGAETVLVAEHDTAVRSLIASALERRGYRLLIAASGEEAVRLAHGHSSRIDLLITDIVLARTSGRNVAAAVRARRPETKVLYVSGCPDDVMLDASLLRPPGPFLSKPFTPDALARKVRAVLDVE